MGVSSRTVVVVLAGLLLAGCGGADDSAIDPVEDAGTGDASTGEEPVEEEQAPTGATDLDALAEQVATEVAEREGVDVAEVTVVAAEEVTWPDGAIGCPDDDGMYTQALVEGYRIIVEVDGGEHHYHGATGQEPFRCDDPKPPVDDGT